MLRYSNFLAIAWSCAASLYLLLVPAYSTLGATVQASEQDVVSSADHVAGTATLLQVNGLQVLFILAVPVVVAFIPLLVPQGVKRSAAAVAGILVGLFSVLGAMSIGLLYMPAAMALLFGALFPQGRGARADV